MHVLYVLVNWLVAKSGTLRETAALGKAVLLDVDDPLRMMMMTVGGGKS